MKEKNFEPLEKFLKGIGLDNELTEEQMANISVSNKNSNHIYNYNNNVLVPRGDQVIRLCRGIVINRGGELMNFPFERFFNYHEAECDSVDIENAEILEKLDGSLISVWHDGSKWEVTTRGSFYPNENAHNFKETFMRLFEEFDKLMPGYTYMFELISKDNRIVTKYDSERVVLIGARDLGNLNELNQKELDQIAEDLIVDRPKRFKASNIDECRKLFDGLSDDEEGLVIIDKDFNRFKLKQESYLKMAKIISLKSQDVLDYMLGRLELDADFTDMPELKEKIKQVQNIYIEVKDYSELIYDKIKHIETQKDFAAEACDYEIRAVLFNLRKGIEFDDIDIKYNRLAEYHNSVKVAEKRKLIILRGVPGSGKSTWIKENNLEKFTLCPDTIRLMFSSPNPRINQDNDSTVWSILFEALENRMSNGDFTVIDAVHAKNKTLSAYKKLCEQYRYVLIEKRFDITLDEAVERNSAREEYKKVPVDVIMKMHDSLSETLIKQGGME